MLNMSSVGETVTLRASSALGPPSHRGHLSSHPTTHLTSPVLERQLYKLEQSDTSSPTSSQAAPSSRATTQDLSGGNLDLPSPDAVARSDLLRDAVFPDWSHDNGGSAFESPEEMQKKDPLGTQIWKLYSRTKTRLPNQERMENLTWRMMAMNLKRREQMQALYVFRGLLMREVSPR